ncbi:MAG: hypothetical protein AVDCRST_MAG90-2158, partial [uncultured Microvirga sp.]
DRNPAHERHRHDRFRAVAVGARRHSGDRCRRAYERHRGVDRRVPPSLARSGRSRRPGAPPHCRSGSRGRTAARV